MLECAGLEEPMFHPLISWQDLSAPKSTWLLFSPGHEKVMHKVQALASVESSCAIVFLSETIVFWGFFVCFCFVVLPSEVFGVFCVSFIRSFGPDSGKYCECIESVA